MIQDLVSGNIHRNGLNRQVSFTVWVELGR